MLILARIFQALAILWLGIYLLGMIAILVGGIQAHGFWGGWRHFAQWMSPYNVIDFVIRLVQLAPALVLFYFAAILTAKHEKRRLPAV